MTSKLKLVWNFVDGKKTYIVSAVMFLYAIIIVGWQQGDWHTAGEMILQAFGLSGLRHALSK